MTQQLHQSFEEEVFTVDANGKVTMVYVTPATLCNIVAHQSKIISFFYF